MKSQSRIAKEHVTRRPEYYLSCLRNASLFSGLSDEEMTRFHDVAQLRYYKKGKILYLQEDPAEFFYVICSGWIKLFHTMKEGEEIVVDMLTAGDIVGESSIFEKDFYTCNASIIEDVQLISIPSHILKERIQLSPRMAFSMLSSMSRHHRRHYSELSRNAMQSAPQRIGCFLLRLCPTTRDKDIVLHLPYDKTLIASTLGMKGATFSRALNTLRSKTGIRIDGARVQIDRMEKLTKFVYGPLALKYVADEM